MKAGELSRVQRPSITSRGPRRNGLVAALSETAFQNRARAARALAAAGHEPVGQHRGVHGAGRGPGDALHLEPLPFEEPIEHASGEGAVRPATLQGQIDLHGRRFGPRLATPSHRATLPQLLALHRSMLRCKKRDPLGLTGPRARRRAGGRASAPPDAPRRRWQPRSGPGRQGRRPARPRGGRP